MRRLPPLVVGAGRRVLPLADASAARLAELLLTPRDHPDASGWNDLLRGDPALLVWTVGAARRRSDAPQTVAEAAAWLVRHALEVLRWDDTAYLPPAGWDAAFFDRCGDAIQAALTAAEAAEPSETAALAALLHNARDWINLTATPDQPAVGPVDWLPSETPAAPTPPSPSAVAARNRWLEPHGGLADWLPMIARRLSRLAELETQFDRAVEREKLESMAEFAAGAGHEINNPLTVIAGRAQLFLRDERDPERRRALALINAQAMRVYEMIADMRLFARPPQPELQTVDLAKLLDQLVADFIRIAAPQDVRVERLGDAGPVMVRVDPAQIAVALRALCQNALEAMAGPGHITLELRRSAGEVELRLADDGPGILPEHRRHIFDPFYSARQAGRGLGMGLSKCWRIVTNHGGWINVDDRPGGGVQFTIRLP